MLRELKTGIKDLRKTKYFWHGVSVFSVFIFIFFIAPATISNISYEKGKKEEKKESLLSSIGNVLGEKDNVPEVAVLDIGDYDRRMTLLANNPPQPQPTIKEKPSWVLTQSHLRFWVAPEHSHANRRSVDTRKTGYTPTTMGGSLKEPTRTHLNCEPKTSS
jgi:hypothetical protein